MWRDDAYLLDMLLAARDIQDLAADMTWERFAGDRLVQHGFMRLIQIIGEAARKVSPESRAAHPEIPWQSIVSMRHRLVHDYNRILVERVWEVMAQDIPPLIALLEPLVPPEAPSNDRD
jgi:uncharacterized protein with HEPN domain